jgi:3-oxoacyl-[acyl-carrier-protein] synthase-3
MNEKHMKDRLNEVSMNNWLFCIDRAFEKSGLEKRKMDYLAILHIKRSMHLQMLNTLNLTPEQSFYLENIGHAGQIDQIISIEHGLNTGKIKEGSIIAQIAAGIGYAWAANVIKWG